MNIHSKKKKRKEKDRKKGIRDHKLECCFTWMDGLINENFSRIECRCRQSKTLALQKKKHRPRWFTEKREIIVNIHYRSSLGSKRIFLKNFERKVTFICSYLVPSPKRHFSPLGGDDNCLLLPQSYRRHHG